MFRRCLNCHYETRLPLGTDFEGCNKIVPASFETQASTSTSELTPATLEDHPIIQNLGRFYVYDMSEYVRDDDWATPSDGFYECVDFKKY